MGILNVTPDSFSDGGSYLQLDAATAHALELFRDGSVWVDIGGESTRPGAQPVSELVELERVLPVLERISTALKLTNADNITGWISIDTMKSSVAMQALQAGAVVINDVSGLKDQEGMLEVLSHSDCGYVLTHCQGTPQTMQISPHYEDCLSEVLAFFENKLQILQRAGVALERVVLDPGFGFGKTWQHNRELLLGLSRIAALGRPVLVGLSRKSFIGQITRTPPRERLGGSIAAEVLAIVHGAHIVRTHEPRYSAQAIRVVRAILSGETVVRG